MQMFKLWAKDPGNKVFFILFYFLKKRVGRALGMRSSFSTPLPGANLTSRSAKTLRPGLLVRGLKRSEAKLL